MSIYSNVTEQDLINLRKLWEQQKNQRALKIKNRILKETHDKKLAENLSITKKLDEVNESTQKLGDIIKDSNSENDTPQLAIENTPTNQPIENGDVGKIYDVELENTLKNMRDNTGFFKRYEDPEHGWMLNGYFIKIIRGTEVEINDKSI